MADNLKECVVGQLEGKKAVIVGAAGKGNMGQAIAKRFRKEGADVLVTSRRPRR